MGEGALGAAAVVAACAALVACGAFGASDDPAAPPTGDAGDEGGGSSGGPDGGPRPDASDDAASDGGAAGGVTLLAAGATHACAVRDGRVFCWGHGYGAGSTDTSAQRVAKEVPFKIANPVALAAGTRFTCVGAGGQLGCWGEGGVGQLGYSPGVAGQLTYVNAFDPVSLEAGSEHACGLTAGGDEWCWGWNATGAIDQGALSARAPLKVGGPSVAVSAGGGHTCSLAMTGVVTCWGQNDHGQIGDGTTAGPHDRYVLNVSVDRTIAIAAGGTHTCAASAANVYCWGANDKGQLGISTGASMDALMPGSAVPFRSGSGDLTSVVAGLAFTCALFTSGEVWCWGDGAYGQLGGPALSTPPTKIDVPPVKKLAAGDEFACAADATTVYCWGKNDAGQLGRGSNDSWIATAAPVTMP